MSARLATRAPCAVRSCRAFSVSRAQPQPVARPQRPLAPRPPRRAVAVRAESQHANIVQVDAEQLEAEILGRDRPLIIDFYATWCGPCVLLAKELETVAERMGDAVRILKIDTDKNPDISTQLQIHGLPTLIFVGMDANKPALRTEGLLPAQVIQEIVERDLAEGVPGGK